MRTSGLSSATMHGVPAGVAQLAEQPSCKRSVEPVLTWSVISALAHLGTYSAWFCCCYRLLGICRRLAAATRWPVRREHPRRCQAPGAAE
jgi:hypothetical protein